MKHVLSYALLTLASLSAQAQTNAAADVRYRVDLIVFLDKSGGERPGDFTPADPTAWLDLEDASALAAAGIERLSATDFGLARELQKLKLSKRYQPLLSLAWTQKNPPAERGPALRLRWGKPLTASADSPDTLDGSVALLLGRYLHLDVDLGFHVLRPDGSLGRIPLRERRRMKRDELHYLDSPKLGVLAKVARLKAQ